MKLGRGQSPVTPLFRMVMILKASVHICQPLPLDVHQYQLVPCSYVKFRSGGTASLEIQSSTGFLRNPNQGCRTHPCRPGRGDHNLPTVYVMAVGPRAVFERCWLGSMLQECQVWCGANLGSVSAFEEVVRSIVLYLRSHSTTDPLHSSITLFPVSSAGWMQALLRSARLGGCRLFWRTRSPVPAD